MREDKITEIFFAFIFLVLTFAMILLILNLVEIQETQKTIPIQKKRINNNHITYNIQKNYFYGENPEYFQNKILDKNYFSYGKKKNEEFFGTYANDFKVYVENYVEGKYYTVRFYFEDDFGKEKIIDMRKYIFSKETEVFHFRDISKEKGGDGSCKYRVLEE